jgi:hypothetical protein
MPGSISVFTWGKVEGFTSERIAAYIVGRYFIATRQGSVNGKL